MKVTIASQLFVLATCLSQELRGEIPLNGLTDAEKRGGWELLFDGKTTDGWRNYQKDSMGDGWVVRDGAIHWTKKGAGDIVTVEQFENFELSLEYRISSGGNSGLMFHVQETEPQPWKTGPEIQIQDNVAGHDPQKSGWLYQLYKPVKPRWAVKAEQQAGVDLPGIDDATRPAGEWNQIYLRISPRLCQVAVNGVAYYTFRKGDAEWEKRVAESKFARFPNFGKANSGHICLQDHGNEVAFRNLKIRRLSAEGEVPAISEEKLNLVSEEAFPEMKWAGFEGVDDQGRIRNIRPMALTHAGDGSQRIFAGTQRGVIYVFANQRDTQQARIFLDLRDQVADWKKNNEEGFLGLAFHPDYGNNGHFYVYYTSADEVRTSVVSRFSVSANSADQADPQSEQVIMKIDQPFSNHNGGSIAFGTDGYLYIGLGDGGGRNDPLRNGQNPGTLMGSILRIDVDHQQDGKMYAIPSDNPFVNREGAQAEIFAYGFRNVWRLTVDRETGDIWAADVGQDFWEEINIVKSGGNYGWSVREASFAFNNQSVTTDDELVEPVWEYDHQTGKSITGGFVYRGKRLPELQGMYLYADYISGRIWALEYDSDSGRVVRNVNIASAGFPVLAFGEDETGEVYYTIESVNGKSIFWFARPQ